MVDGILNVNKPKGETSFNIVSMVRRLSEERRVGHAGTLDPEATGVLPICLGQGTRVVQFLVDTVKDYRAEIELGVATDTYDAEGKVIQTKDSSHISESDLESALDSFTGVVQQAPPMYSALKYRGWPLYKWARLGIDVERPSRLVNIHRLEIVDWQPPVVTIEVVCGKGTYIRSLAHDFGQALGCGANLKNLTRLRCGPFDVESAVSLTQLEDAFHHGYWQHFINPVDFVLFHLAAVVVGDDTAKAIRNGRYVDYLSQRLIGNSPYEDRCRAYTTDGCFLAVLGFNLDTGRWQPEKVFPYS